MSVMVFVITKEFAVDTAELQSVEFFLQMFEGM